MIFRSGTISVYGCVLHTKANPRQEVEFEIEIFFLCAVHNNRFSRHKLSASIYFLFGLLTLAEGKEEGLDLQDVFFFHSAKVQRFILSLSPFLG